MASGFQETTFSSGTTSAGPNIQVPVTLPPTVASGDILVMFVKGGSPANPTGWTALGGQTQAGDTRVTVYWREADGSEGGTTKNIAWYAPSTIAARTYVAAVLRYKFDIPNSAFIESSGSMGAITSGASPQAPSNNGDGLGAVYQVRCYGWYNLNAVTSGTWSGGAADRGSVTHSDANQSLYVGDYIDMTGDSGNQILTLTASGTITGAGVTSIFQANTPFVETPVVPDPIVSSFTLQAHDRRASAGELPYQIDSSMDEDDLWP